MKERETVLIVGSGGREHAVGWKLSQSGSQPKLLFTPGNAGTAQIGRNFDIDTTNIDEIVRTAKEQNAFIFVGPELPLQLGIANAAQKEGLKIFGPTQEAARLETSKSWAIEFMRRYAIPHPQSAIFSKLTDVAAFLEKPTWKEIVIKADGLAAGKGVLLPNSKQEAVDAVKRIMIDKEFDDGSKIIIQERLKGREMSLIVITDGTTIVPLPPTQDYKRVNDNDKGPNTGGMGAFAPAVMTASMYREIYDRILRPTVDEMRREGNLFQGVLYAGLMLTDDGPKVLEFNARLGDPETQVQMMLLGSDLLKALKNTVNGELNGRDFSFRKGTAICTVVTAEGYPDKPVIGDEIYGLDNFNNPNVQLFHAGTKLEKGKVVTNGGRIIGVAAYGKDQESARQLLYPQIGENGIHFRDMHFRTDIGK